MDESIFAMKVPDDVGDVVAHLYEHLFIQSFYKFLRQAGHNEAFLYDLQGETFRDTIFLYNNVVDNEVNKLLQQILTIGNIKKVWGKIQIYSIDEFEYNGKPKGLPLR